MKDYWIGASKFDGAFSTSPEALIKRSLIAENLKKSDATLVHNSINFCRQVIKREFQSLHANDAFIEDWPARS